MCLEHFKHQPHKMVKQTQTIRQQKPTNYLSVFGHFVGLVLKGISFLSTVLMEELFILSIS